MSPCTVSAAERQVLMEWMGTEPRTIVAEEHVQYDEHVKHGQNATGQRLESQQKPRNSVKGSQCVSIGTFWREVLDCIFAPVREL